MNPLKRIITAIRALLFPTVEVRDVQRVNRQAKRLEVENTRRSKVKDCREMYDNDPRIEGLIDKFASDIIRGGFSLKVDNPQAQTIANDLIKRLKLFLRLDDWLRMAQRDGDLFLELSLNGRDIAAVTRKPTLEMHRNSDETDQFIDPEAAYWQAEELWFMAPPGSAIWFADYQIIHARWNHDEGERYGRSQFFSAVSTWKKLTKGEENVIIRRIVRAGMKLYHYVEGGWSDIGRYREENQYALDNPAEAAIDYFGNSKEGPKVLQGDAQLNEIDDIKHFLYTLGTATPVPLHSLGYGDDLNRDVLEDQHKQYQDALPQAAQWLETEVIKPLIEMQWLLYGIYPPSLDYELVWARDELDEAELEERQVDASLRKAEAVAKAAEAGQKLAALGWSDKAIANVISQILVDVELDIEPGLKPDAAGRLGAIAQNGNGNGRQMPVAERMGW